MAKRIIISLLLILFIASGGLIYAHFNPDIFLLSPFRIPDMSYIKSVFIPSNSEKIVKDSSSTTRLPESSETSSQTKVNPTNHVDSTDPPTKALRDESLPKRLDNPITLYLKNGGVVAGEFVKETPDEIVLGWDYGDVGFNRNEIIRVVKGKQVEGDEFITLPWEDEENQWEYKNDVVVKLMRGTVIDAQITSVTPEIVVLKQKLESGGAIEHEIARSDIERLMFKPINNERSNGIQANLRTIFPKFHWHNEGLFTIVTDSLPPTVKKYRRTIQDISTDWYLTFFPLLKDRSPTVQQHVVIFDSWISYIEYALTDGLPGWVVVGYYNPQDEILYCFNMVGEQFTDLIDEAYFGEFRRFREEVSSLIKGHPKAIFLEGQLSEFNQKLETYHAMYTQWSEQITIDIMRHELVHGMFHNWRVQGIVMSHMSDQDKEKVEKKREFLEAKDVEKKRKLLEDLFSQERQIEYTEVGGANSWYIEGLAGYMESSPVGDVNKTRLSQFQDAIQENRVFPLEFLHTFRMGSFMTIASQSTADAYSQSWALSHFLIHNYHKELMEYLDRLAKEAPDEDVDTLPWLINAIGKEQRVLEQEFIEYIRQFPHEDPEWLKRKQFSLDRSAELRALMNRMWSQ